MVLALGLACGANEPLPLEDEPTGPGDQFHQGGLVDAVPDDPELAQDACEHECSAWEGVEACPLGSRCVPRACTGKLSSAMVCRAVTGHDGVGQDCTIDLRDSGDSCGAGLLCVPTASTMATQRPGRCVAYCDGSPEAPACPGAQFCAVTRAGALPLCLPSCDLLQQDCVLADELCVPVGDPMVPVCVPGNDASLALEGEACDCVNCCAAGFVCVDSERLRGNECEDRPCCARLCERGAEAPCGEEEESGLLCRALQYVRAPGTKDAGICTRR